MRKLLEELARRAIAGVSGEPLVFEALRGRSDAPWIVGAGKAVAAMARGAQRALGDRYRAGPLLGKHPDAALRVVACGHPLPDERGVAATAELLSFLSARSPDDLVIFLLSGGASALLCAPIDELPFAALRDATARLLDGGASIHEINVVRRHLCRALGGRLATATSARIEVLALSDVVGDDWTTIGSGPAAPDPTTFADAHVVAQRYALSQVVCDVLARGARGAIAETRKPGDPHFDRVTRKLLATPLSLLDQAGNEARRAGLAPKIVAQPLEGDVADVAEQHLQAADALRPGELRIAVGEPTVRVMAGGLGGRGQQLSLLMARAIAGRPFAFASIGSDGSDGPTDAAGAVVDGESWNRAIALRNVQPPDEALAACNAYPVLDALGALVRTGPTGTNLLDLHLLART